MACRTWASICLTRSCNGSCRGSLSTRFVACAACAVLVHRCNTCGGGLPCGGQRSTTKGAVLQPPDLHAGWQGIAQPTRIVERFLRQGLRVGSAGRAGAWCRNCLAAHLASFLSPVPVSATHAVHSMSLHNASRKPFIHASPERRKNTNWESRVTESASASRRQMGRRKRRFCCSVSSNLPVCRDSIMLQPHFILRIRATSQSHRRFMKTQQLRRPRRRTWSSESDPAPGHAGTTRRQAGAGA